MQQLCVLALGVITWVYNRQLKKLRKGSDDQKASRQAMVALLRDRFYEGYRRHMKNGYYPIPDREVMRDIYEQYHALGGNGVITHLMEEMDELPTYDNH